MGNEHSKNKEITKNGTIHDKHENGSVNGLSANITSNGLEVVVNGETIVHQNGEPFSLNFATESTEPDFVIVESDCQPAEAQVILELPEPTIQKEEVKKSKEEKVHLFGKMFKKKAEPPTDVENIQEKETSNEDQKAVSPPATDPQLETATLKQESESLTEPESVTQDPRPEEEKAPETDNGDSQPVENQEESDPEENPVMNFFKTLVTSTKTSKKETATPDATKEQSQKETQPAATITAAQVSEPPAALKGMSIPPPPPPEPPKMEVKGEPAAKPVKPTPKEEPKAAAKEPEPSKATSAKDTLSKFFRPKKVDPSKAGTLEAAAKPEPPPPAQEEKKTASKSSFFSFFKPKGAEPKKATPAPAAATTAEAAKTKEEPKAAAKSSEVVVDNKQASVASQAGDDAANVPKKLEKRNSIHLFFKNLGQKRHSTDAGVQTEAAAVAPAAEKAK
ncbi:breast carcinoma-amplified sequence 1 isoform X9 [Seriola aureovittata]|uniref:breast carcinoma-amplified sequence 1 isoform X9 n=1 Tax=Seriola aureovittata TaxID=2871759 RepID=UPI0024BDC429|nr:breast carcinoma-amplified sequence 1 isoform X9 [Seriola aureovittata]